MAKTYEVIRGRFRQIEKSKGTTGRVVKELPEGKFLKEYAGMRRMRKGDTGEEFLAPQEGFGENDRFFRSDTDVVAKFGGRKFREAPEVTLPKATAAS